ILENGSTGLSGSFVDPGTLDTHTVVIAWGDGSANTTANLAAGVTTFSAISHQYLDDNPTGTASDGYTISVTVTDDDGGSTSGTTSVTVTNVAPAIATLAGPLAPTPKGAAVSFTATFTDVGSLDTHTCLWTWDDGSTSSFTAAGTGNGTCSTTHVYAAAGVYTVHLTVTDDDTGSAGQDVPTLVVVYDPDAGFVTGGGWITTAAGSYPANPSLSGRANFGFVAKYKKGATVPEGQTEFQFQVGNLNFHSELYQSLVVSGCKAQYRGTGTINGSGSYDFVLTAYDAAINGCGPTDRFRIKITSGGTTIYDNRLGSSDDMDLANPQNIDSGSIVIHK
ncbi:MAG TPA: PKD domain-containing protein, partial [Candidatus Deferrimicrobium sp.]|nr:PKD domain-containing protein [Candidatus Deferrimicrobium sp.]